MNIGRTIKDTLTNQLDKAGPFGLASTAVSWAQRAAQRTPVLNRLAGRLEPPPLTRQRPGTGKHVVLGSGKGGAIAITHPGADSSAKAGTPGQILYGEEPVHINIGREAITLTVVNTGDRPITVGSHYHFAETNAALEFDRKAAWGRRQNIMAGSMTRFDPGAPQEVELVPYAGRRVMPGFRGESSPGEREGGSHA
ncbi:urease subunit beta [Blastococcus sp. TF02A-35]|nr:urease subunit beta [Blastococcus sp. TF02A_35]TFV46526.1 urease subunit beta [Blastococcus sp. TF02A_35]